MSIRSGLRQTALCAMRRSSRMFSSSSFVRAAWFSSFTAFAILLNYKSAVAENVVPFGKWAHADYMTLCTASLDDEESPLLIEKQRVRGTGWECEVASWKRQGAFWKPVAKCFAEGSAYDPKILVGLSDDNELVYVSEGTISVSKRCNT
jgi:hypothetical protein